MLPALLVQQPKAKSRDASKRDIALEDSKLIDYSDNAMCSFGEIVEENRRSIDYIGTIQLNHWRETAGGSKEWRRLKQTQIGKSNGFQSLDFSAVIPFQAPLGLQKRLYGSPAQCRLRIVRHSGSMSHTDGKDDAIRIIREELKYYDHEVEDL